jgi:RNA polymerase sigma factor (sigma-70 family)
MQHPRSRYRIENRLRLPVVDDLELFARWQAGDMRAGNDLFTRYFDSIYRFFECKVWDKDKADELAQKTFANFVEARDTFRRQSTVRTYLFAIARNELRQYLRTTSKRELIELDSSSLEDLTTSLGRKLHTKRETERLLAALRTLTIDQQTLLELHYWCDMDAAELAEVFDLEPGTIRTRLSRARAVLHERLASDVKETLRGDPLVGAMRELDTEARSE